MILFLFFPAASSVATTQASPPHARLKTKLQGKDQTSGKFIDKSERSNVHENDDEGSDGRVDGLSGRHSAENTDDKHDKEHDEGS